MIHLIERSATSLLSSHVTRGKQTLSSRETSTNTTSVVLSEIYFMPLFFDFEKGRQPTEATTIP